MKKRDLVAWLLVFLGADLTVESWLVAGDHLFSFGESSVVFVRLAALLFASMVLVVWRAKRKARMRSLWGEGFGFACKFVIPLSLLVGAVMVLFIRNASDPEVQLFVFYSVVLSVFPLLPLLVGLGMLEPRRSIKD